MKSISVHLTDTCNNSCRFCVVDSDAHTAEKVDMVAVQRFIKRNAGKRYEGVTFVGGEATLVNELPQILEQVRELGFRHVAVQTNGRTLSNPQFAETLAKTVDLFVVSLHGNSAEQQDFLTQIPNSFEQVVAGIKNAVKFGSTVYTNTVMCKQNIHNLADILDFAWELGASRTTISNIHTAGRAHKNFHQVVPRLKEVMPKVKEVIRHLNDRDRDFFLEGFPACSLGEYKKYMKSWEDIEIKLLYRRSVLRNYEEFIEKSSKVQGPPCQSCSRKDTCGGIYKEYIDYFGWDEFSPDEFSPVP